MAQYFFDIIADGELVPDEEGMILPDCELPLHLAELGVVLWMSKDVEGWKALIEGIK